MLRDTEGTHRLLYEAHWAMVSAGDKLHQAILACVAAGRHADARNKLAEPVKAMEEARNLIDAALISAGNGRTKLIHQTGCDGTCSEKSE